MNDLIDLDDLESKIFRISWENVNSGAEAIATNISNNHDKPDVIICKQFDVTPASIVARILKLPLCVVYPDPRVNNIIVDSMPKFSKPIRSGEYNQPKPKVAIICSLVDDNQNVDDLVGFYSENKPTVMSIYSRKNVINPPTYQWVRLANGVTAIFPWEEK